MKVIIRNNSKEGSIWAAHHIAEKIKAKAAVTDKPFVLGLCTGSTPIETYAELARMVQAGELSFRNVISFNMDEYVGLPEEHPESYHSFMRTNLFSKIDEPEENIHILNGNAQDLDAECAAYEKAIVEAGGFDLFLGGIGEDGHIAFNEPAPFFSKGTQCVDLTQSTIDANKRFFEKEEDVPRQAYTMGIGTIMSAKKILLIAAGEEKADIMAKAFAGPITPEVPASVLQLHPDVTVVGDKAALSKLLELV